MSIDAAKVRHNWTRISADRVVQLCKSEQDSYLCLLSLDDVEGWLKGDPEGELHILGPVSQWDTPTMMSFS